MQVTGTLDSSGLSFLDEHMYEYWCYLVVIICASSWCIFLSII